ncbi:hypothetical protein KBZ21_06595 [Streptomyces sp. A73]|nr:hypothetical protein [Streptomyces sp. A73]
MNIKDPVKLSKAKKQLTPRVQHLLQQAEGQAERKGGQLVGVAIHVDLDHVTDNRYMETRDAISQELSRIFDCQSALALAAVEMEAWLLLFPEAFPKVRAKWQIPKKDHRRDCGQEKDPKKYLQRVLTQPKYSETDAPKIIEAAVKHGLVTGRLLGTNRSFTDFVDELQTWR